MPPVYATDIASVEVRRGRRRNQRQRGTYREPIDAAKTISSPCVSNFAFPLVPVQQIEFGRSIGHLVRGGAI